MVSPVSSFDDTALAGLNLLFVATSADERDLYALLLGRCGAFVVTAAETNQALAILERGQTDALVSEIGIPGSHGCELVRRVRSFPFDRGATLAAIAATAWADQRHQRNALAAGFDAVIAKPHEPAMLVATIHELGALVVETRRLRSRAVEQQEQQRVLCRALRARRFALVRQQARFDLASPDPRARLEAKHDLLLTAARELAESYFEAELDELRIAAATHVDDDRKLWTLAAVRGNDVLLLEVILGPRGAASQGHFTSEPTAGPSFA